MAKMTNFALSMEITDLAGARVSRLRSAKPDFISSSGSYFSAAVRGTLKGYAEQEEKIAGAAIRASIKRATRYLKNDMDRQMRRAGITSFRYGSREWWVPRIIDEKKRNGIETQGKVYSGFGRAAYAFEHGAVIRARDGKWLAIPASGEKTDYRSFASQGQIITVPTRNPNVKRLMLRRKGQPDMLLAWLYKQVTIKKKINFFAAAEKWGGRIPEYIVSEWTRRAEKKGIVL